MAYFDLNKLNLALKLMYWKRSNRNCSGKYSSNRRDELALKTHLH